MKPRLAAVAEGGFDFETLDIQHFALRRLDADPCARCDPSQPPELVQRDYARRRSRRVGPAAASRRPRAQALRHHRPGPHIAALCRTQIGNIVAQGTSAPRASCSTKTAFAAPRERPRAPARPNPRTDRPPPGPRNCPRRLTSIENSVSRVRSAVGRGDIALRGLQPPAAPFARQ